MIVEILALAPLDHCRCILHCCIVNVSRIPVGLVLICSSLEDDRAAHDWFCTADDVGLESTQVIIHDDVKIAYIL